jgi:hypothetical protein
MLGRSKGNEANYGRDSSSVQQMPRSAVASPAVPEASSISSGLSIVGKIVGHGSLTIFGHVEGELHASTVVIAEGAQMEGDVVAERPGRKRAAVSEPRTQGAARPLLDSGERHDPEVSCQSECCQIRESRRLRPRQ